MTFPERFAAHLIAYGPIVMLAVLAARGRRVGRPAWIVAGAFLVSAPADIASLMLTGPETWAPTHFYPLPQWALFAWAAISGLVVFVWSALAYLWVMSLMMTPLNEPEVALTVLGGLLVALVSLRNATSLRPTVVMYCGVGSLLYLMMVQRDADYDRFMPWWYAYQSARLLAFMLFGWTAWRESG